MNLVERAYALAASGEFHRLDEIERTLRREGYEEVTAHLSSRTLRRQLKQRLREAAGASAEARPTQGAEA
jgi:hypothetical protein